MKIKKLWILGLVVLLLVPTPTSRANPSMANAQALNQLGLLSNISEIELNSSLNRIVGLTMILKALGYKTVDAQKSVASLAFGDFGGDLSWGAGWANLGVDLNVTTGTSPTTFSPAQTLSKKEFLSFQLRVLGYGVEESWSNCAVLSVQTGLIPTLADTDVFERFTKGEAAQIMYKALNTPMKDDSSEMWIEHLIREGIVNEAVAISLKLPGLNQVSPLSIKPITNTKIEVLLNAAIKTVNPKDFTLINHMGIPVQVNSALLSADGLSLTLQTGYQTPYASHTLTTRGSAQSFTYTSLYSDTTKPRLTTAVSVNSTTLKLTFNEPIEGSGLLPTDFTINDTTVLKVDFAKEKDADGKNIPTQVILTTTPQVYQKQYKLTITGLKDLSENEIDTSYNTWSFVGKIVDNMKPKLLSAVAINSTTVQLTYSEGVEEIPAETLLNYELNGLTVTNVVQQSNTSFVLLTTSEQMSGYLYTIKAKNIIDVENNPIDLSYATQTFLGKVKDTSKPILVSAVALTSTIVKVTFNEPISEATGTVEFAYLFDGALGNPAKITKDTNVTDGTVWMVTTQPQLAKSYLLDVTGVMDLSGNTLDEAYDTATFQGIEHVE